MGRSLSAAPASVWMFVLYHTVVPLAQVSLDRQETGLHTAFPWEGGFQTSDSQD